MSTSVNGSRLASMEIAALGDLVDLIRSGTATTRPDIGRATGWGRAVVSQRIGRLMFAGVIAEGELGPSTGGRQPRSMRFRSEAGTILAAEIGATSIGAGLADLDGRVSEHVEVVADVAAGPDVVLAQLEALFDELLSRRQGDSSPVSLPVVGVGVGLPGPVEYATGRPISPPIMPGWDEYPVRSRLSERYEAPVWIDNEVNMMALGELRGGTARDVDNVLFVKLGTGIGAGVISHGRLHRGSQGCAGDLGHVQLSAERAIVCRCGNTGCLEALAGGAALARDGLTAARDGSSPALSATLAASGDVTARDVAMAATRGDTTAHALIVEAGRRIGQSLAAVVNILNPSLIVIGGGVARTGDLLLAVIRRTVYEHSLPLATRDLSVVPSSLDDLAGITGAAHMVIDELLSPTRLRGWIDGGAPGTERAWNDVTAAWRP